MTDGRTQRERPITAVAVGVVKKLHFSSSYCAIIFDAYRVNLQHNSYRFNHLTYVPAAVPWRKSICCFGFSSRGLSMLVRRSVLLIKFRSSFIRTYCLRIFLILFQLIIECGAWCKMVCIRRHSRPVRGSAWSWKHCGRRYWWMAWETWETSGLCGWNRKPFWTLAVITRFKTADGWVDKLDIFKRLALL